MVSVTLSGDIGFLTDLEKQHVPFALARALQDVGDVGKKALNGELTSSFQSPTSFTQRGAFRTSVEKGETTGRVGVKDRQAEYLDAEFFGGTRSRRPFESRLKTPFGVKYAIPTDDAPKDRFGNVPPWIMENILRNAEQGVRGFYFTNTSLRYRAKGSKKSTAMFNLVDAAPRYKTAFDLDSTSKAVAEAWPEAFERQLKNAIANPKGTSRKKAKRR